MTIRKIEQIKALVDHPLEEFFNIEPHSTEVTKYKRQTELVPYSEFDDKDSEIEESYQEIYDAAMTGYDNLQEMIDTADTKFAARLGEVSVQHLNVALAAAGRKANLKENKDKLKLRASSGNGGKTTNNIVLIEDRNELLRRIMGEDKEDIIEGQIIESDEN